MNLHGLTLTDLETAADPEEWAEVKDDPRVLEAFAKALSQYQQQEIY